MDDIKHSDNSSPARPVPLCSKIPIPLDVVWHRVRDFRGVLLRDHRKELGENAMSGWKKCPRCGKLKPAAAFGADASKKSGLRSWCKECCKQYDRDNYDPEKRKRMNNQYIARHPDVYARNYLSRVIDPIHERSDFHNSIEMEEIDALNEKFNLSFGGYSNDEE